MKKLISSLSLSLCCIAASAQPTSFGGITPGKTTLKELKGLVKKSDGATRDSRYVYVTLKQPEDQRATVGLQNGVAYGVEIDISFSPELKQALIAKYGSPQITIGGIKSVICQNKFGGSFNRYEGMESRLWPVKDGVQGGIEYFAGECAERISERYALRHIATGAVIEEKRQDEARRKAKEQRGKLDGAL